MNFNQIDKSKNISLGTEPVGPNSNRIKELIFNSLNKDEYRFRWIQNKSQPYKSIFFDGLKNIDLYIYAWRISNGGKGRNRPSEKRIQIPDTVNNIGFNRQITDDKKTILIGIYENSPVEPIFAAWDVVSNRDHTQKSCQVQVEELAKVLDEGIFETKDTRGNIIYTFTSEYLGKYIELVQNNGAIDVDLTIPVSEPLNRKVKESTLLGKKVKEKDTIKDLLNKIAVLSETEKESIVKTRVGQGLFKKLLIKKYNGKCCICGLGCSSLLIGSHIKAWSKSENNERLDVNNGLLLCYCHDSLFDKYLISFTDKGEIIISDALKAEDREILGLTDSIKIEVTTEMRSYLEWHRTKLI
jgi:predicted restriction endonuclease